MITALVIFFILRKLKLTQKVPVLVRIENRIFRRK